MHRRRRGRGRGRWGRRVFPHDVLDLRRGVAPARREHALGVRLHLLELEEPGFHGLHPGSVLLASYFALVVQVPRQVLELRRRRIKDGGQLVDVHVDGALLFRNINILRRASEASHRQTN